MIKENKRTYTVYIHTLPKEISGKDNDMFYIGITSQNPPKKRWQNGNPYRNNSYFYNAIKKYGFNNFKHEILLNGLDKKEAEEKEIEFIKKYQSNNRKFGYNIANGGNCIGTMSKESKDKIAKANMGNKYSLGHKHTEESKRKISQALKGNKHSKGLKMPEHVMRILIESRQSEEVRQKISIANTGKKHTEETKKKLSESHKGLGSKKVMCVETGIIYNSIKDAANANNIKGNSHISSCCTGLRKTCAGYHWRFVEDCEEVNNN